MNLRELTRATFPTALLLAALVGCTVGPDYTTPATSAPDGFSALTRQPNVESKLESSPAQLAGWWKHLGDPTLDSLIERAINGNLDLKIATYRVREARAARGVVASRNLPDVNAAASYDRSRQSENISAFQGGNFQQDADGTDLYQAGFDAFWELDVFGGIRRGVEAADADVQASLEARRDVLISLLAEVALNYVEVRSFQKRTEIAIENVRIQQDSLSLSTARFEAGVVSELDVAQAKAQVESGKAAIPPLNSAYHGAVHRLGVLLGMPPTALLAELESPAPIPSVPPSVAVGTPADLLRRRADIRRAEREVAAQTARVGVATADLYPKFTLVGSFGFQSAQFSDMFDMDSRAWSVGPGIRWSAFNGGRVRSLIAVQDARMEQAILAYEQTVLSSLEETENAATRYSQEQARRDALRESVSANRRAVELANFLYTSGVKDFLNVLVSQRALFDSEEQLAQSEQSVASNLIALYKSLGGGWEAEELRWDSQDRDPAAEVPALHPVGEESKEPGPVAE